MIDSYYRKFYQRTCVEPLLPFLQGFSLQLLTLTGLILGLAVCPMLALGFPMWALGALWLSGFFDTLDGSLARSQNTASPKGAALDIISDRGVEIAVIMGLFLIDTHLRALACMLMLSAILLCITTFLVAGIFTENQSTRSFHYSPGWIERSEAFIFFTLMIISPEMFFTVSYLFSFLTLITAIMRLCSILRNCETSNEEA